METFLDLKKQNPTYTCQLFSSPPRDATKLSLHWRDLKFLNLYPQVSARTKRPGGPWCLVLLYLWAGHTILMVTQAKKLMKTKVWLLRSTQPQWNSKLNTWFSPFYRNSWQTQCWDALKYTLAMDLHTVKLKLGTPSLLYILLFIPLQYWSKYHHLKHLDIIRMSLHDALMMSCSFWWESMCMCLVCWVENLTQRVDTIADAHPPFMELKMVTTGTYHDTLPHVPWCNPTLGLPD